PSCSREQSRPRDRQARDRGRGGARRREPRSVRTCLLDHARPLGKRGPPSNFLLGDSGVDVNDWFSSTGVRQRLLLGGGTWSASWDSSRTTTTNPITSFDPALQAGFQLAVSQPLLRDRRVDSARYQYVIAKRNQQSSELRFRESAVQTIAAVKQAYWTLKATRANVTVQQRSLQLAEELARQTKIRVEAGQIPPLDLVQAE